MNKKGGIVLLHTKKYEQGLDWKASIFQDFL